MERLCALLACGLLAAAQPFPRLALEAKATLPFRSFGPQQGLRTRSVNVLERDARGFVLAGTDHGVYRFDGSAMTLFGKDEGLPSPYVMALRAAPDGKVWVGTARGLALLEGNRVRPFGLDAGLPQAPIHGLDIDARGGVWVAVTDGVYHREGDGPFELLPGWPGGRATAIHFHAPTGSVWIGRDNGLLERRSDGSWHRHGAAEGLDSVRMDTICIDPQEQVWARSAGRLWCRPKGAKAFVDRSSLLPGHAGSRGAMCLDAGGRLWLSGEDGAICWDGRTLHRFSMEQHPCFMGCRTLLPGQEGELWVAGRGLHRLLGHGAMVAHGLRNGLPSAHGWTTLKDRKGRIWAGTERGLARLEGGRWTPVQGIKGTVRSMAEDRDGRLWLALGPPAEVVAFDPDRGRIETYGAKAGLRGTRAMTVGVDPDGTVWVGTMDAGLFNGRREAGGLTWRPVALPDGDPFERVSILGREGDRLWVGGGQGLALLEGGKWRRFRTEHGLAREALQALHPCPDGSVWVGYLDEPTIHRVKPAGDRLEILEERHPERVDGLMPRIFTFEVDPAGALWVGTSLGIQVMEGRERTYVLGEAEGLPDGDISAQGIRIEPDGDLWVCTAGGIGHAPQGLTFRQQAPVAPTILGMRWGGQEVASGATLREGTGIFRVQAGSPEGEGQLEARMESLGEDWRPVTTGVVEYAALPSGPHRLAFRIRSQGGSPGPVTICTLRVHRPLWRCRWFWALLAAGAAGVGTLLARRALGRRDARIRDLEARLADEREAGAGREERMDLLRLRDPITGLRNRTYVQELLPREAAHVLAQYGRSGEQPDVARMSIFLLRLDGFAAWKDQRGPAHADGLLEQAARELQGWVRAGDRVARWADDTFLVLATGLARGESVGYAERMRRAMEAMDLHADLPASVSCSVGFASFPFLPAHPAAVSWESVLQMAGVALDWAEQQGGNQWVGLAAAPAADPAQFRHFDAASMADLDAREQVILLQTPGRCFSPR